MTLARVGLLSALAALTVLSCKSKDAVVVPPDDPPDATTPPTEPPTTEPVPSEYGLDERPANTTCLAPARPLDQAQAQLERVYPAIAFDDPIWLGQAPGVADWWYVAEQRGRVLRFPDDPAVTAADVELVLDLQARVDAGYSESGLLGLAFHPDFGSNGEVYLSYTADGSPLVSRISRLTSPDGGATIDPLTEQIVLSLDQPDWNHNGGHIAFGPDGYLYAGFGDGGGAGDPSNYAQNTQSLLGKMLRIDVDVDPYGIPADNPFADGLDGRPEIFAWGLRNPWRWSFDPATGELYVGDVGQNDWEEVDIVELGGNYGWRIMEGNDCYNPAVGCNSAGLQMPVAVYANSFGASVVGGVVYHGAEIPELQGIFLYSDFGNGNVYGLYHDAVTGLPIGRTVIPNTGKAIGHFVTGPDGEVHVVDHGGGLYRISRIGSAPVDPFPQTLSATGCVLPEDPSAPVEGMIPYDLNHPFWSDGGDKERWLAIPDGTTITVDDEGDWELPIGSVLLKHFRVDGALVESRLFVRHDDGDWAGYAYEWRSDGTDADLLPGGKTLTLASQVWSVPDRGDCLRCHTAAAGGSLGLETQQLNRDLTYPSTNRVANQIATLEHIGVLATSLGDPASLDALPGVDASATVEERARAYLHVNCSMCHRPGGNSRGDMDFRVTTALADMDVCRPPEHGDLGVAGAQVVAAGDPTSSVLSLRVHTRDVDQMPPIGTNLVDDAGAALIDGWIDALTSCP